MVVHDLLPAGPIVLGCQVDDVVHTLDQRHTRQGGLLQHAYLAGVVGVENRDSRRNCCLQGGEAGLGCPATWRANI